MSKDFESEQGQSNKDGATIGASISIRGEVTGAEDLLVLGSVEGTINLKENTVTVGKSAKVSAHIYGKSIHVEGEVVGDLYGSEQVVVHKSGYVRGNITAPRLSLEDGARLKGAIDTETSPAEAAGSLQVEKLRAQSSVSSSAESAVIRRNGTPMMGMKTPSTTLAS